MVLKTSLSITQRHRNQTEPKTESLKKHCILWLMCHLQGSSAFRALSVNVRWSHDLVGGAHVDDRQWEEHKSGLVNAWRERE